MVKRFFIFLLVLCFLFQACSAPVSVGYNKNIVIDNGGDNWFNTGIELPDNSLVEFTVIGSLEYEKDRKDLPAESSGKYSYTTTRKKEGLSSEHKILKAKVLGKEALLEQTFVIDSSNTVFCANGGYTLVWGCFPGGF